MEAVPRVFLPVQCLGRLASPAGGLGLIPSLGTKMLIASVMIQTTVCELH